MLLFAWFSSKFLTDSSILVQQCLLDCYLSYLDLGEVCFLLFSSSQTFLWVLLVHFSACWGACFRNSLLTGLYMRTRCLLNCSFETVSVSKGENILKATYWQSRFSFHVKLAALLTLVIIIVINLAVGILPHVDNFAHIGGFLTGFLLGFVFLIRPQFGWVNQRYAPLNYSPERAKPKFKKYQCILWVLSLVILVVG